ncbi:unnamed protein product [Spirodela intermedia]|uniref:Uncharacterized protein n=1 Tax=Spirodela intermedia TaxID=51605 RepID=A0A7I8KT28_SPIIN|nr:unnamed protein product [Spirodela intermedia]
MEAAAGQWEEEMDLRRGPWTVEEDLVLVDYIATHGEGRWNSLARCAGLKRTGKSCRLRWLNYLRPDVRRGNITPEEQLLILELHSRWGNRWSRIAQCLPGRTDNEIKNYWRTRVQKHAKQLKCDVNSKQFKDAMRYLWMPRLAERIRAASDVKNAAAGTGGAGIWQPPPAAEESENAEFRLENSSLERSSSSELSAVTCWSSPPVSEVADCHSLAMGRSHGDNFPSEDMIGGCGFFSETLPSPFGCFNQGFPDLEQTSWGAGAGDNDDDFPSENLWTPDDAWFLQQMLQ